MPGQSNPVHICERISTPPHATRNELQHTLKSPATKPLGLSILNRKDNNFQLFKLCVILMSLCSTMHNAFAQYPTQQGTPQWMITKVTESGSSSGTVNGITKTYSWSSPGPLASPVSSYSTGGYGVRISGSPNSISYYYLSSQGTVTFTVAWVYPDGTPGPNPTRNVTLAITPYAQAYSGDICTCSVDDGFGDPSLYDGPSGGLYSGYTVLNGNLMPHTQLIPLTATGGIATYTTPNMSANLSALATYNDFNAQGANAYNMVQATIDNRAIVVTRTTPAVNQWFSPSDSYTFHGDTTYGWSTIINSTTLPPINRYISNWQSFQPAFLGSWKSTPPVSYNWTPNESQDTWNSALWDIADGGQKEIWNDLDLAYDWTASPKPMSGTIQYTATDSDNATFTGQYDMNIHPMVEPMSGDQEHEVVSDPVTFGAPPSGQIIQVWGPDSQSSQNTTYAVSDYAGWSVNLSTDGIPLEEIAQCCGIPFPGTIGGSIGYSTSTETSITIAVDRWPSTGIRQNYTAFVQEIAGWERHVLDYRSFSTAGEAINWDGLNDGLAIAHRNVNDDGPITLPELIWDVVPNTFHIPNPSSPQPPPISTDSLMPPPLIYDPHSP